MNHGPVSLHQEAGFGKVLQKSLGVNHEPLCLSGSETILYLTSGLLPKWRHPRTSVVQVTFVHVVLYVHVVFSHPSLCRNGALRAPREPLTFAASTLVPVVFFRPQT